MIKKVSLLAVISMISIQGHAAEWLIDANAHPTLKYDDNELLRDNKQGDFSLAISPTVTVSRALENAHAMLDLGYQVKRYNRLERLDRQDPFARFTTDYSTERSRYGLSLNYSKRESRSFADEDAGNFSNTSTVTSKSVSPSFDYQLTELDSLSTSVVYANTSNTSLTDTRTITTNIAWQHQFSERLSAGLSTSYVNFESDSILSNSKYDSYALSLTSSYAYSELWNINASLGARYLDSEVRPISGIRETGNSTGKTYSLSATRKDELNTLTLDASLAISPTTTGTVNEQNFYTVTYSRSFSERLSSSIRASYREFRSPDNTNSKTTYSEFSPSLKWNYSEKLVLNLAYKYRMNEDSTSNQVESNSVFVTLNYDWDGLRFSR